MVILRFETKDQSNKRRFLEAKNRSKEERLKFWFQLISNSNKFYPQREIFKSNFTIKMNGINDFERNANDFVEAATKHKVEMLLVGGGAVNFHGYQRHSADIDFWVNTNPDNMDRLKDALHDMGLEFDEFPKEVLNQEQNISLKFSPVSEIELITNFNCGKSFDQAYKDSEQVKIHGNEMQKYNVLSYQDLITSKIKSGRTKDLLDIKELRKINLLDDDIPDKVNRGFSL